MLTLKGRQDGFRIILPDELIPDPVNEKYSNILASSRSFIYKPIDFLTETIQRVEVLGFENATYLQKQMMRGEPILKPYRIEENNFPHMASDVAYRSPENPVNLIDKTLNIEFKHTLGYMNYFILFESFIYMYSRDMDNSELPKILKIELLNETGAAYAILEIENPVLDGIDMLSLDFTRPVAESSTFKTSFKYSNFNYSFKYPVNVDNKDFKLY